MPKTYDFSDTVGAIMRFEDGQMDHDETVAFLMHLRDTGLLFHLQGFYGRTAHRLGLI